MMRIKGVKVSGFRGLQSVNLNGLSAALFVTGDNYTGKTSFLDALRYVLTRRAYDADRKKIRNDELITRGYQKATIQVLVELGTGKTVTLDATITPKKTDLAVTEGGRKWAGSATEKLERLWGEAGITQKNGECGLFPERFLFGDDIAQRILEALDVSANVHDVTQWAKNKFDDGKPIGDHESTVQRLYDRTDREMVSPGDWTVIGKIAYDERAELKKDIAVHEGKVASCEHRIAEWEHDATHPEHKNENVALAALREKFVDIDGLNAERERLARAVEECDKELGRIEASANVRDLLEQARSALAHGEEIKECEVESLATAQTAHDAAQALTLEGTDEGKALGDEAAKREQGGTINRLRRCIEEQEASLEECSADCARAALTKGEEKRRLEIFNTQLADAQQTKDAVEGGRCVCGGACPKCDGRITKTSAEKYYQKIDEAIEAAQKKRDVTSDDLRLATELQEKADAIYEEVRDALVSNRASHSEAVADLTGYSERAAVLRRGIDEVKAEAQRALDGAQRTATAGDELRATKRAEIVQLEARLGAIDGDATAITQSKKEHREILEMLFFIVRQDMEHEALHDARKEVEKLSKELALLEWAVEQFKDGAFYLDYILTHKEKFERRVNARLAPFGKRFGIEPDNANSIRAVLYVPRDNGSGFDTIPLAQASDAERAFVCYALGRGFVEDGVVLVDGVDALEGHNKGQLLDMLKKEENGSTIFCGAWALMEPPDMQLLNERMSPARVEFFQA